MTKTKAVRTGLLGSAAALALLCVSTAQAYETKFGNVQITLDTTVSMGASVRTAARNTAFLPEGNGGPQDPRELGVVVTSGPRISLCSDVVFCGVGLIPNTGSQRITNNPGIYSGSINGDDGRLNFDTGDLIGGNVKASHDLQVSWNNYKVFVRAVGFYDAVLNDKNVGARSELTDAALGDVGRNYELLDAFISADYSVLGNPVNVRVGKQVINWGESTFIQGGNNVFNPIDVAAIRRPGSEIKEALVPVAAALVSVSLPFDVSVTGYYALGWDPIEIDPSGTPFAGSDVVTLGSGAGGNINRYSFISGSPLSGERRNCAATGATARVQAPYVPANVGSGLLPDPTLSTAGRLECSDSPLVAATVKFAQGLAETQKLSLINAATGSTLETNGIIERGNDRFADETGDYGISFRYLADWAEGTEFGFYFQNYASRLPLVSYRTAASGVLGHSTFGQNQGTSFSSAAGPNGCGYSTLITNPTNAAATAGATIAGVRGIALAANGTDIDQTLIADPHDLLNGSTDTALQNLAPGFALVAGPGGSFKTVGNALRLNCALHFMQSEFATTGGLAVIPMLGAETVTLNQDTELFVEYPENIDVFGLSFNSTIFGWGVQGDFTYRPNAPFQVDTDSLTIAAGVNRCALEVATGASTDLGGVRSLRLLLTPDGTGADPRCGGSGNIKGYFDNEMATAQIGTTATFTGSEWWVADMGADTAVLVTEVGMVYVPGVEDTWIDKTPTPSYLNAVTVQNRRKIQYQNIGCQGTDLPIGGLLALDKKTSKQCRPTDLSGGLVALLRWEYSNAFNTGFLVAPQIVYSYDFSGATPAPYSNYLEDRQSIGLSVTGTLNNNFRLGASYSNFFGGHIMNKAKDTDFASFTASYTF